MKLEWKKVKEEKYRAGYRKMLRKTFILPNGDQADYDVKDEPTSCHILALTPDNKVILQRMFRPGPEKIIMDMPCGFVDKDETPKEAAERELLEELGMKGEIELAGISADDAYTNTIRHTFVIKNCKKVQEPQLEKDEIFEVVEMSIAEFRKLCRSGNITHAESGYIALDHLGLL